MANDQIAPATEIHDPLRLSSASGDTVVTVEEEEDEEETRTREELRLNGEWVKKMRGWLMVVATISASITYSAGLNPPGGFWQDDSIPSPVSSFNTSNPNITTSYPNSSITAHIAGNPVLADRSPTRYYIFVSCNASAFTTSIAIIVLLLKQSFFHAEVRLTLLKGFVVAGLFALVMAFVAGITQDLGGTFGIVFSVFFTFLVLMFRIWQIKKKRPARPPMSSQERDVELGAGR